MVYSNDTDNCEDTRECEAMRKIFVGGVSKRTSKDNFAAHFAKFGTVLDSVIMTDRETQEPRGFGFVTFDCSDAVENVFKGRPHELDGKTMDPKRAMPRELNNESAHAKVTRLFVGGVTSELTEEDLRNYIDTRHSQAGQIKSISLLSEKGIGFIECDSHELADRLVISEQSFILKGKKMNIKKAEQRRSEGGGGDAPRGGGRGRGMRGGGGDRGGRGGRGGGFSSGNQGGGYGGQSSGYGGQSGGYAGQSGGYAGQSGGYGGQSGGYGGQSGGYAGQSSGGQGQYANQSGYTAPAPSGYGASAGAGYGQSSGGYGGGY